MRRMFVAVLLLVGAAGPAAGQTSFGAGVVFGEQAPRNPGLQVSGSRPVGTLEGVRVGADFVYHLSGVDTLSFAGEAFEYKTRLSELNGNLQYHFAAGSQLSLYALGGINLSRHGGAGAASSFGMVTFRSRSQFMFNPTLGAGIEVPVGPGVFYGEGRYLVAPGRRRAALGVGLRIGR